MRKASEYGLQSSMKNRKSAVRTALMEGLFNRTFIKAEGMKVHHRRKLALPFGAQAG
jgi:hypothetical protein